jgi:hypothetical protein
MASATHRSPKDFEQPLNVWGPQGWYWLHTQAIKYPVSPSKADQAAMFARFWAFIQTLPCPECKYHATAYARAYPPDFSGSAGFQTWAWRFHNAVNLRLGKPLMSAEEYQATYEAETTRGYWNCI